jgi:hypothetical protein
MVCHRNKVYNLKLLSGAGGQRAGPRLQVELLYAIFGTLH